MKGLEKSTAHVLLMFVLTLFISVLPGCGHWDAPVSPPPTTITVSSTVPENGATAVPIGNRITATFSGAMDPATITSTTFTLSQGGTAVPGTVTYSGVTAVFTPGANLLPNTVYTARITTGAKDPAGGALATDYVWSFTTGAALDTTPPTVIATINANGATGVPTNTKVGATFSEAMDPSTITATTFTFSQGGTPVPGTVTYAGVNAVFTPTSTLAASTTYTATITAGARDLGGNALASAFVWSFTTAAAPDTTPPRVIATLNANGATNVPTNTKVGATFSEAMDPLTITTATFTFKQGATPVAGTLTYSGVNAVFTPTSTLAASTTYTATITTGARDLAGNALASDFIWSFTTGAAADIVRPTVNLTFPADAATGVLTNTSITATFSEPMDPSTINAASFTVAGATGVTGTVGYNPTTNVATFTPTSNLAPNTIYTATISTGARDLAGNALAVNKVWTFTTGATAGTSPVALGEAAHFGVFGGGAGMTNQGIFTVVNGDIGTTAASTLVTGFHDTGGRVYTETTLNSGTVNGTIYTATAPPGSSPGVIAAAAALAAQNAYNNLSPAALPGGIDVSTLGGGPGELGSRTLAPGIYQSAPGSFAIQLGDLTLDARGDANAVWVFQMASSLTVGGPGAAFPRSVLLINGAQAKNVFWQVGSAATINAGGGGTMVGTIIASAGVAFSTAGQTTITTLEGRALSLNASVTLVNTHINVPAP